MQPWSHSVDVPEMEVNENMKAMSTSPALPRWIDPMPHYTDATTAGPMCSPTASSQQSQSV
jgi:hypothetical protein